MAALVVPPRTPSPKVRIRSQSFDSPSSRISVTPIDDSPCSKSTGAIVYQPFPRKNVLDAAEHTPTRPANILIPLHTKMSDDSMLSSSSDDASSESSSPTTSEMDIDFAPDSPLAPSRTKRQRPHPLAFCQTVYDLEEDDVSASPFLYQDKSCPMHSPWLVRAVLDLHDVRGLDWMSIAGSLERFWGVRTSTAEVLDILSDNGRVNNRRWWD